MPHDDAAVHPSRRSFVQATLGAAVLPLVPVGLEARRREAPTAAASAWPSDPRHDAERVAAVVGASHGDLDRVREFVLEQPGLAKASWDWGFGDWETPLGAASHVGRRDIAEFLLAHGARPTVFSAAMMGELEVVRAFLDAEPGLFRTHGPHGISLTRHALAGGTDAAHVVAYLSERFGPDPVPFGFEPDDEAASRYSGRYRADDPAAFGVVVGVRNDMLMVGTGETPTARLLPVEGEPDTFHPSGAPAVRIRFLGGADRRGLVLEDGPFSWRGTSEG